MMAEVIRRYKMPREVLIEYYRTHYKPGWRYKRNARPPYKRCNICKKFFKTNDDVVDVKYPNGTIVTYHEACWQKRKEQLKREREVRTIYFDKVKEFVENALRMSYSGETIIEEIQRAFGVRVHVAKSLYEKVIYRFLREKAKR